MWILFSFDPSLLGYYKIICVNTLIENMTGYYWNTSIIPRKCLGESSDNFDYNENYVSKVSGKKDILLAYKMNA